MENCTNLEKIRELALAHVEKKLVPPDKPGRYVLPYCIITSRDEFQGGGWTVQYTAGRGHEESIPQEDCKDSFDRLRAQAREKISNCSAVMGIFRYFSYRPMVDLLTESWELMSAEDFSRVLRCCLEDNNLLDKYCPQELLRRFLDAIVPDALMNAWDEEKLDGIVSQAVIWDEEKEKYVEGIVPDALMNAWDEEKLEGIVPQALIWDEEKEKYVLEKGRYVLHLDEFRVYHNKSCTAPFFWSTSEDWALRNDFGDESVEVLFVGSVKKKDVIAYIDLFGRTGREGAVCIVPPEKVRVVREICMSPWELREDWEEDEEGIEEIVIEDVFYEPAVYESWERAEDIEEEEEEWEEDTEDTEDIEDTEKIEKIEKIEKEAMEAWESMDDGDEVFDMGDSSREAQDAMGPARDREEENREFIE